MRSLLDQAECERTVGRIEALTPGSRALWGKMDVAQMLAHCRVPLRVAMGEVRLRRNLIGILFGRMAKRMLLADRPFRRNGPTAPEFRVTDPRDFAAERDGLIAQVRAFQRGGTAGITREPHPFFGPMSTGEWETLQWKHLDHHLRQFGA